MSHFKSIILANDAGESLALSNEEALARRVNSWKGWLCSASVDNVHVSPDGNVFAATCKVGGLLGNVYDDSLNLPDAWITCTKNWCTCGSDMQLRKARSPQFIASTYARPPQESTVADMQQVDWVAPYHFETHQKFLKNVTWDISRRCNYSCSYCHPAVSNTYEAHKSWGSLQHAADSLIEQFCRGHKARWVFTGGEPTINPSFMRLARYLHERGHRLHTQTNGSRTGEYFSDLIRVSCIGISVHLEFCQQERLLDTISAILETKQREPEARAMWFGIRIMVPPDHFDAALALRQAIVDLPGFDQHAHIHMSPLCQRLKQEQLMPYKETEITKIEAFS